MSRSLTRASQVLDSGERRIALERNKVPEADGQAPRVPSVGEATANTGATVSLAVTFGVIGGRLAAVGILALVAPAALQAGAAHIALIAQVAPRASISGVSPAQETVRRGNLREETVKVRLSANTGYRLVVVGTAPLSSKAEPAPRLWVKSEKGSFEELRSGVAVTVLRGRHAVAGWEPEVSFRSEASESVEGPQLLPVRYEVRIDPAI